MTNYQEYPSILILKHVNVLAEVIKSHDVHLYKITSYKKHTVLKYTYAQWPYWKLVANKRFKNPVYNDQGHWVPSTENLKY